MKIINKFQFTIGIINISLALVLAALTLCKTHIAYRYVIALICLLSGIMALIESTETEKQRQKKIAELQEKAKLYGWDKKQTRNLTDEETEIYNSWIDSEAEDTGEKMGIGQSGALDIADAIKGAISVYKGLLMRDDINRVSRNIIKLELSNSERALSMIERALKDGEQNE